MSSFQGNSKDSLRSFTLLKQREKELEEIQKRKDEIAKNLQTTKISNKFVSYTETLEDELKSNIVGLVTLDEMKKRHEKLVKEKEIKIITETLKLGKEDNETETLELFQRKTNVKKLNNPQKRNMLSFADDIDGDGDEDEKKIKCNVKVPEFKKMRKNPDANTSYLPDKDRDQKERIEREKLINEWIEMNNKIKDEEIIISYLYWDGSGHRRTCKVNKGKTIEYTLQKCLTDLRNEFLDLKNVSVEKLMFIKEDLILPHHYTIYDFLINKFKTIDGTQIFNYDNPQNLINTFEPQIEKSDTQPAKICIRSWYDRNKHIYPANLWKPFDPDRVCK